jgi:hypothetical protein
MLAWELGFFDLIRRYESLDEKSDPLVVIAAMVPFESFRSKSRHGRTDHRRDGRALDEEA